MMRILLALAILRRDVRRGGSHKLLTVGRRG